MRSFGSDNHSGVHPEIMKAIVKANLDHTVAYGEDPWTERATAMFKKEFGSDAGVFFVYGGTGANVLAVSAMTRTYHGIICSSVSHLWMDECGAPEGFIGCRLIPVQSADGKLTVSLIERQLEGLGDPHMVQPKVVSITQSNEIGLVYTHDEIRKIARFVHSNGMFLHLDGSRLANAVAHLGGSLRENTRDLGVDALSFGGTKSGMMYGEAVLFFSKEMAQEAPFLRKRATQLPSKLRFVSAQFEVLLKNKLWLKNARQANRMAALLAKEVDGLPGVKMAYSVDTNMVFTCLSTPLLKLLSKKSTFYVRDITTNLTRWVASYDTTEKDVHDFVRLVKESCKSVRKS